MPALTCSYFQRKFKRFKLTKTARLSFEHLRQQSSNILLKTDKSFVRQKRGVSVIGLRSMRAERLYFSLSAFPCLKIRNSFLELAIQLLSLIFRPPLFFLALLALRSITIVSFTAELGRRSSTHSHLKNDHPAECVASKRVPFCVCTEQTPLPSSDTAEQNRRRNVDAKKTLYDTIMWFACRSHAAVEKGKRFT